MDLFMFLIRVWDYLVWFDVQKVRFCDYFLEEQWTDLKRCQSMSVPIMPSPDTGFWSKYVNEFLVSWSKRQILERSKKLVHGSAIAQTPSPLGILAVLQRVIRGCSMWGLWKVEEERTVPLPPPFQCLLQYLQMQPDVLFFSFSVLLSKASRFCFTHHEGHSHCNLLW